MRPTFRYCTGWACAALTATTVSWVAIRDVVVTAAVGDPVPAHAVVAGRGVGSTVAPTPGRVRLATPSDTAVPSASLSPRARKPVTPPTGVSQATSTSRPEASGSGDGQDAGGSGGYGEYPYQQNPYWQGPSGQNPYWQGPSGQNPSWQDSSGQYGQYGAYGGGYGSYGGSQTWDGHSGEYRGFTMRGGQVVVRMGYREARLVSAVPASGYSTRTSTTDFSIRVEFVDGERRSTLLVTWSEYRAPSGDVTES